jgi:type VI secretion system protein ImpE
VRLARKTVWTEAGADVFWGAGQRILATDVGEHPLMDVRTILIGSAVDADASANPDA